MFDSQVTVWAAKKRGKQLVCATFNETMTRVQTWKCIRQKSNIHRSNSPVCSREEKKTQQTRRGVKTDSSNPTSGQPPSLLPPVHQLIYSQGDSNQAVRVHFTHPYKQEARLNGDQGKPTVNFFDWSFRCPPADWVTRKSMKRYCFHTFQLQKKT